MTKTGTKSGPIGKRGAGLRRLDGRAMVREAVQEEIVRFIANNALRPGDQLPPEGEIARSLGVGRNSVREAVGTLRTLGVIDVKVGSGLFVRDLDYIPVHDYFSLAATFDFHKLLEIRDIRMYIEKGLVEGVIDCRTQVQADDIQAILDAWKAEASVGAYPVDLDRNFHQAFWREIGNPVLSRILEIFWDVVRQGHQRGILIDPLDKLEHFGLHRKMFNALKRGDAEELRGSITAHYNDVKSRPMLNPALRAASGKSILTAEIG
jgi:DNA-binding FadR family transcriptional regulator